MIKHTKLPWINGYGDGITGPSTPAINGPTVHEQIAYRKWQLDGCKPNEYPKTLHTVISKDGETIAIIPLTGLNGEANAHLIAAAPDLLAACEEIVERTKSGNPRKEFLLDLIQEAAEAAIEKAKGE